MCKKAPPSFMNAEQAFQLWRLIINLLLPIRMISSYLRFNLQLSILHRWIMRGIWASCPPRFVVSMLIFMNSDQVLQFKHSVENNMENRWLWYFTNNDGFRKGIWFEHILLYILIQMVRTQVLTTYEGFGKKKNKSQSDFLQSLMI